MESAAQSELKGVESRSNQLRTPLPWEYLGHRGASMGADTYDKQSSTWTNLEGTEAPVMLITVSSWKGAISA